MVLMSTPSVAGARGTSQSQCPMPCAPGGRSHAIRGPWRNSKVGSTDLALHHYSPRPQRPSRPFATTDHRMAPRAPQSVLVFALGLVALCAAKARSCPASMHQNTTSAPFPRRAAPALRVLVAFGTRPEIIKLWPVMDAARSQEGVTMEAVNTGQRSELVAPLLGVFNVHPVATFSRSPDASLAAFVADSIRRVDDELVARAPHLVLVQGDTASAFAAAVASFHCNIPVAHVEAGLRSYHVGAPFPEEFYRRSISLVSSLHFAPTHTAADALTREGVPRHRVLVTGNTVVDALRRATAEREGAVLSLAPGRGYGDDPTVLRHRTPRLLRDGRHVVLWTSHRRETARTAFAGPVAALKSLSLAFPRAIFLVPLHSSGMVRRAYASLAPRPNIRLLAPPPYNQFARLLHRVTLVATDSGGIMEESVALGLPTVVIRDRTERGEGVTCGTAVLGGTTAKSVFETAAELLRSPNAYAARYARQSPFGDGYAAERIVASLIQHGRLQASEHRAASEALAFHPPQVGGFPCGDDGSPRTGDPIGGR